MRSWATAAPASVPVHFRRTPPARTPLWAQAPSPLRRRALPTRRWDDWPFSSNVSGFDNTAVGRHALISSVGNVNTAVGSLSLDANTSGAQNTALGGAALGATITGSNNVAVGVQAGFANTTGSGNTFIGQLANAGSGKLTNATAIGANAQVDQSNALVLGAIDGINSATENTRVGIGLTAPETLLDIEDRGGALAHRDRAGHHSGKRDFRHELHQAATRAARQPHRPRSSQVTAWPPSAESDTTAPNFRASRRGES